MELMDLWLPVLVSAVFVFIASSVIHMATPMHRNDHQPLADEDGVMAALREKGVGPGEYALPCPKSMQEMGSPEMLEKYKNGPVGFLVVLPNGPPAMGKSLTQWFLYSVLVSLVAGYVGTLALTPLSSYHDVFRLTGTIAIALYGMSNFTMSIWKGVAWFTSLKFLVDGIIYGLVTAGTFGWLWPDAF